MALLDAFESLLPTGGRASRKLIASGALAEAIVVGVRVTEHSERADRWEYSLDVHAADGTFRAGCRQSLHVVARRAATVGGRVPVRHDGKRAIIDEDELSAGSGAAARTGNTDWKAIDPPPDGISDDRLKSHQRKVAEAQPTTVTVTEVEPAGGEERWTFAALVDAEEAHEVPIKGRVPDYAASRVTRGARLPAGRTVDGTVLIDWIAAVSGIAPPVFSRELHAPTPEPVAPRMPRAVEVPYEFESKADAKEFQNWLRLRAMQSSGPPASSVAPAMRKFGVDPDAWPTLDAKWMDRCESNANLAEQLRLSGGG